jgi:hypothetical protein
MNVDTFRAVRIVRGIQGLGQLLWREGHDDGQGLMPSVFGLDDDGGSRLLVVCLFLVEGHIVLLGEWDG